MPTRTATCACGQLTVTCAGEPVRHSLCHCLDCQRRTGSVFGVQVRFPDDKVVIKGTSKVFTRTGDSGGTITYRFCPDCGSTMTWTIDTWPGVTAVPVGAFADPDFPPPTVSVYNNRRHHWVPADLPPGILHES